MKPLIEAVSIQKTYGRQQVLNSVGFVISEGQHIGLVGRNGAGKTTLLKILAGDEEADSGTIQHMPWTKLGVLRQHEQLPEAGTTLEHLETSGKPSWTCAKLAARFGLQTKELAQPPRALSGGYQMRVKLVRMLLDDPNILLLDEPMNYLDLPTLLLLEAFLQTYTGTFVMTSHDREAMQNVCTSTWEIAEGDLTQFPGDLETYLAWKEEQREYALRTNKRLRRDMNEAQAWADRFRAKASLASRAQNKLKHIARLRTQLKDIKTGLPVASFHIRCPHVIPGYAVRAKDLSIGYDNRAIGEHIEFEFQRGTKIAIVGENGHGKTTLLKTLASKLPVVSGTIAWWHNANIGYFSQQAEDTLVPTDTVLDALTRAAPPNAPAERILAAAGAFLFKEDDLEKPCSVLSGGERARVRLAALVLHEHNVLILDEPTNHLDTETVEVLALALKEYTGTVLIVSHARSFMNTIIDTIYEVHHGQVRHYTGTYEEYVLDLAEQAHTSSQASSSPVEQQQAEEKKERAWKQRTKQRAQQKLEARMKTLDKEKSEIHAYYFENPLDYAPEKATRLSEIDEEIAQIEAEWLKIEAE